MTKEQIDAKIAELKAQMEKLVSEANRQIGFLQGQIAAWEERKNEVVDQSQ